MHVCGLKLQCLLGSRSSYPCITLVTLALAIVLISKILRSIIKDGAQKPAPAAAPVVSDEADKETLAVLMATIGMDLELPADQFKIVNVKEL